MNLILALLSILFTALIGTLIIKFFDLLPKKTNLYVFSIGFGLGVGLIYSQMYLYSRLGISWSVLDITFPWIVFLLFSVFKRRIAISKFKFKKIGWIEWCLILGIFTSSVYTIFEAIIRPLATWDSWANWILKSNAFFLDKGIKLETLSYIKSDGPLVVSSLGSLIYLFIGKIDDTLVLLASSAFYIFLTFIVFSALRERMSFRNALIFSFLLTATQALIRQGGRFEAGQADLPLGFYFFISTILFLEYLKSRNPKILILTSVFLAITSLIKFEGMPFILLIITMILFDIYKSKLYKHLLFLLVLFIPFMDWQMFKKEAGLGSVYFSGHALVLSFQKIINAIKGTVSEIFNAKTWFFLWIAYFISLFSKLSWKNKDLIYLNIIILSQIFVYLAIYFFTFGNDPNSSIERLLVHLAPLAIFEIAILYNSFSKS